MKQVNIFLLVAGCVAMSGCGLMSLPSPMQKGNILLAGDADGMRALGDTLIGIQAESKSKPNVKSAYFVNREQQEAEITARENHPGFLTSLFSGGAK